MINITNTNSLRRSNKVNSTLCILIVWNEIITTTHKLSSCTEAALDFHHHIQFWAVLMPWSKISQKNRSLGTSIVRD